MVANVNLPGEFQAGPGFMAAQKGVPSGLPAPSKHHTGYPQDTSGIEPARVTAAQQMQAAYITNAADPAADDDPLRLGAPGTKMYG